MFPSRSLLTFVYIFVYCFTSPYLPWFWKPLCIMKACHSDLSVAYMVFINTMYATYMNNMHISSEGPARIQEGGEIQFLLTACLHVLSPFDPPI